MSASEASEPHAAGREAEGLVGVARDDHTVELTVREVSGRLPSRLDQLRDQLPGLEPERHLTDWGRSERIEGIVDRAVYEFLYRYWFRVEVEGIENVPADGGALLLANHAGALPPDGPMIAKAIREEHRSPRPVHVVTEPGLRSLPGLAMLMTKLGTVSGHPANLQRLLLDEQALVLGFPEGQEGPRKPFRERYRLRRFGPGAFVQAALRARVPIVPIAVLGAEEAMPALVRIPRVRFATRVRFVPRLPLAPPLPLPAKLRIRFLEPVATAELGDGAARDPAFVQALTHDIRALIQENLLELVAGRRSVWLG